MKTQTNLFNRYFHSSNEKLIAIIENANRYQSETVEIAKEILHDRTLDIDIIKSSARSLMQERLEHFFGNFNVWNDDLEIPKSEFLSEEEVLEIFELEYNSYLNDREDFGLNMSRYQAA